LQQTNQLLKPNSLSRRSAKIPTQSVDAFAASPSKIFRSKRAQNHPFDIFNHTFDKIILDVDPLVAALIFERLLSLSLCVSMSLYVSLHVSLHVSPFACTSGLEEPFEPFFFQTFGLFLDCVNSISENVKIAKRL